ncbi:hypothetical protein AB3X93_40720, partial [Paraburkholderia sp. BR14262]|uniref:hypothetical protein n=1 Tax=Paraburkholderia sp. BR14262 TaxID=3236999 RepID=UPI0034CFDFE9
MMTFDSAGFPVCAVVGGCSCAQPVTTITVSKSKTRVTSGSPKIRGDVRVVGLARADLIPERQTFAKKKDFARAMRLPGRLLARHGVFGQGTASPSGGRNAPRVRRIGMKNDE